MFETLGEGFFGGGGRFGRFLGGGARLDLRLGGGFRREGGVLLGGASDDLLDKTGIDD